MEQEPLHGLMAEFREPRDLLAATQRAREEGYRRMDAYSPFPIEGLDEALGLRANAVPAIMLAGGILGGLGGYFMQYYAMARHYPLNVGGRPLHSWAAFIPITFELTVLTASICGLVSMLALNRLPEPYHPVFNASSFQQASQDRFFLCVERTDAQFDPVGTRAFLESLGPDRVMEVRA